MLRVRAEGHQPIRQNDCCPLRQTSKKPRHVDTEVPTLKGQDLHSSHPLKATFVLFQQ